MEEHVIDSALTQVYYRKTSSSSQVVFFVIPGNPGVLAFYTKFIDCIFDNLEGKHTVVGIGHAGHGAPGKNGEKLFSLQEQISHKVSFLNTFPPTTEFVFLGHSVGSYIALKILAQEPQFKVLQVVNLFPTFRNLWEGLSPIKKPMARRMLAGLVHYLPHWVSRSLLSFSSDLVEESHYFAALNLTNNVLNMAYLETLEITTVEESVARLFESHLPSLRFLYGPTDAYAPREYYLQLKRMHKDEKERLSSDSTAEEYPEVIAELAEESIPHAFVTSHSSEVASLIHPWLLQALEKQNVQ